MPFTYLPDVTCEGYFLYYGNLSAWYCMKHHTTCIHAYSNNTHLMAILQDNLDNPFPFWILSELRAMEVVLTTGALSRAKLRSNRHHQQTNTTFYRRDALPVAQPTVSKHWREKVLHSMDLLFSSSPAGLPTFSLTTEGSWLPWVRVAKSLVRPLTPVSQTRLNQESNTVTDGKWDVVVLEFYRENQVACHCWFKSILYFHVTVTLLIFPVQCADTVVWVTGRTSGL